LFVFIQSLLFSNAYCQTKDAETAKKEARGTLIKQQSTQTALDAIITEGVSVTEKFNQAYNDSIAWYAKVALHNQNRGTYDPEKPLPAAEISFRNNAKLLAESFTEITGRRTNLRIQLEKIQGKKDSLNFEIRKFRALLKHKSIDVLKFFNTYSCGQMPGENATVAEWKSYLDCLFDGTPRNRSGFANPANPGGITVFPNATGAIVIPENDPAATQQKQREIKKLLEETEKNKKPKQPIIVPVPQVGNSNENGGSLSAALRSVINQLRPVPPKTPTAISVVKD
jgi:hypothetical protein